MRRYPIKPWHERNSIEKILAKLTYIKLAWDSFLWILLRLRNKTNLSFSHWTQIGMREIRFCIGMNNSAVAKKAKQAREAKKSA